MWVRIALVAILVLALMPVGIWLYYGQILNPQVARELAENPDGERAQKVMLLTLPSGRSVPVNYLREAGTVYAGADGRWWKELEGAGGKVEVLVRGEQLAGHGRAVLDDPAHTARVFERLRPNAIEGFGTLVEIQLAEGVPAE